MKIVIIQLKQQNDKDVVTTATIRQSLSVVLQQQTNGLLNKTSASWARPPGGEGRIEFCDACASSSSSDKHQNNSTTNYLSNNPHRNNNPH